MSVAVPIAPAPLSLPTYETVADLLHTLGDIPAERVLWDPLPGTAREADVIRYADGEPKRLCELVDGTLVEKAMGFYESRVGLMLGRLLDEFAETHDLGVCVAADGLTRVMPGLVRLPDVAFYPWAKFPNRQLPAEPIANIVPDLTVEVLSRSNTRREMARKRSEYFTAGTKLHWQILPATRTAEVYTAAETFVIIEADGTLDGGDVLPGFRLELARLFARAGRQRGG